MSKYSPEFSLQNSLFLRHAAVGEIALKTFCFTISTPQGVCAHNQLWGGARQAAVGTSRIYIKFSVCNNLKVKIKKCTNEIARRDFGVRISDTVFRTVRATPKDVQLHDRHQPKPG